jgi:hypothetical protein
LNLPVNKGTIYDIGQAKSVDSKNTLMPAEEKTILSAVYMASFLTNEMIQEMDREIPSCDSPFTQNNLQVQKTGIEIPT